MARKINEIETEIRRVLLQVEQDGSDEEVGGAAVLVMYTRGDEFYDERFGLSQTPRIKAMIENRPADWQDFLGMPGRPRELNRLLLDLSEAEREEEERWQQMRRRVHTPHDRLNETLATAESSASQVELDEIAWLIGNFPRFGRLNVGELVARRPRLADKLQQMQPAASQSEALVKCSGYRHRDDIVGQVADLIVRCLS